MGSLCSKSRSGRRTAEIIVFALCLLLTALPAEARKKTRTPSWNQLMSAGVAAYAAGDYAVAESSFRSAATVLDRYRVEDMRAASNYGNLAEVLWSQGKREEAEQWQNRAINTLMDELGPFDPQVGQALATLSALLEESGKVEEAKTALASANAILGRELTAAQQDAMQTYKLARFYEKRNEYQIAKSLYRHVLEVAESDLGRKHPFVDGVAGKLSAMPTASPPAVRPAAASATQRQPQVPVRVRLIRS